MKLCWSLLLSCLFALPVAAEDLHIAVVANSKPMSWRDDKGELTGFNVDVARTLCDSIKVQCRFSELPLTDILVKLASNEIDFAVSSLVETEDRKRNMLFTRPYYRGAAFWIGKGSNEQTPHLRVASLSGSIQCEYVRDHEKSLSWKPLAFNDWASIHKALENGEADAAVVPFGAAINIITNRELLASGFGAQPMKSTKLSPLARIAVSKAQGEPLVARLNNALDGLEKNGTLGRIATKHLPFQIK